jgi:hypothetical protein
MFLVCAAKAAVSADFGAFGTVFAAKAVLRNRANTRSFGIPARYGLALVSRS